MKTFKLGTFLFLIFNFLFLIFYARPVSAQNVSLGLWPPLLQVVIKPGKSITQVYKVYNYQDPVIINSQVTAFSPSDELGNINLVDCKQVETAGCDSLEWFSFQNADISLGQGFFVKSGNQQEVVLKITVPEYASEGDYYNSLLFSTQMPAREGGSSAQAISAIASNIMITVSKSGQLQSNFEISEFSARKHFNIFGFSFYLPVFDSNDEIPVILRVSNNDSAYNTVKGKVNIKGFGGIFADIEIPARNILANSTRMLTASTSAELQNAPKSVSFNLNGDFFIGKYLMTAQIEDEDGNKKEAKLSFLAFPIKSATIILLTISAVLIIMKLPRKKVIK